MEKKKLSRILEKTDGAILKGLAEPLIEKYPVQVLRKPGKTMVMIRMKENGCENGILSGGTPGLRGHGRDES